MTAYANFLADADDVLHDIVDKTTQKTWILSPYLAGVGSAGCDDSLHP